MARNIKILIDAGHGINTPGKRSPDGMLSEWSWNRIMAGTLCDNLRLLHVDAELLVPESIDISLPERVKRANAICDQIGASNVLLVSVHANAAGDGSAWMQAKGWSCYTSKGNTESDRVAESLYDAFEASFPERKIRKDMSDGDRDFEENFFLLQKSRCAAVLLENYFYDNEEECRWLLEADTIKRIALAATCGIFNYLKHE